MDKEIACLIRDMSENDIDEIKEMFHDQYEIARDNGFKMQLNYDFLHEMLLVQIGSAMYKIIIAEHDGKPIGFAIGSIAKMKRKFLINDSHAYGLIEELYVKSDFRGDNIGSKLLDSLLAFFEECEVEYVQLQAMIESVSAIKFYERNGFTKEFVNMSKFL